MGKILFTSGIIILFMVVAVNGFVDTLEDDVFNYSSKPQSYVDSKGYAGEDLVLVNMSKSEKHRAWKNSSLRTKVLNKFPDFQEMRALINLNLIDSGSFKDDFLSKISSSEKNYISGHERAEIIKAKLSSF